MAESHGSPHPAAPAASDPGPSTSPRPSRAVIEQVRRSCELVAARPVLLAETFYQQLFLMAPHVRAMFPADMTGQMQKMSDTLLTAITSLAGQDTEELEAALRRLGAQHRSHYGVETDHYVYVGHALTRAVRDLTGAQWSGSLSSAWIAVCQWVATHMISGSMDPDPEPDPAGHLPARSAPDARGGNTTTADVPAQRGGHRSGTEDVHPLRTSAGRLGPRSGSLP
ncbi:MAG: hypothetical protein BGP03_08120 [Pseudonocardia sp. 73-21]|jgi:hemoglobin-like flavoprotein|nr:MAG: hypothetical protein BGP03_08120 [Pseudonocardia sp. 73-21]